MHNTFIAPGSDDEDEMIRTMGDGLYAAQMGGGSVNTATGEFNFAVQEGLPRPRRQNRPRPCARVPHRQGRTDFDAHRPRRPAYDDGTGHVRLAQRQRADQRRPADHPRQQPDGRRKVRISMELNTFISRLFEAARGAGVARRRPPAPKAIRFRCVSAAASWRIIRSASASA